MTDRTTTPTPPRAPQPGSNRFFSWLRGLGVIRADGWIGGVCGGIAVRTGLDPLVVRGIAVVIAILGGPALMCYAAAWLLLPDTHGEIHLERMFRGIFDAPLIAIALVAVATFFPVSRGVWWWNDHAWGDTSWLAGTATALHALWNIALTAAIIWFIVWAWRKLHGASHRRHARFDAHDPEQQSSTAAGPESADGARVMNSRGDGPVAQDRTAAETGAAAAPGATSAAAGAPPDVPAAPTAAASADELAEWRERYAAWRAQHAAWQEQQRAANRAARDSRSAEVRAQSQRLVLEAQQRRRERHAANPRTPGWFVVLALGVALVAGAVSGAVAAGTAELDRYAAPIGCAVALAAIGLAMVVAGAVRRRSGGLAAIAIALLFVGVGSYGWPAHNPTVGYDRLSANRNQDLAQFAGQVEVDTRVADFRGNTRRVITIDQSFGAVAVYVADGIDARISVTSADSDIHPYVRAQNGSETPSTTIEVEPASGNRAVTRSVNVGGATPELTIEITQGHGAVFVYEGGDNPSSGIRIDGEASR